MLFNRTSAEYASQDIKMENMLMNYYRDDGSSSFITDKKRAERRAQGKLCYALIDYDVSIMVTPEISREEYTLPYFKAWIGTWGNQPYDILQAEYEYKPFAFDVGCAGVELCSIFQARASFGLQSTLLIVLYTLYTGP